MAQCKTSINLDSARIRNDASSVVVRTAYRRDVESARRRLRLLNVSDGMGRCPAAERLEENSPRSSNASRFEGRNLIQLQMFWV